jgi:hypothetical protein
MEAFTKFIQKNKEPLEYPKELLQNHVHVISFVPS